MSYTALYRKYRPSTFDDVVGQKHIVTTLTNALEQNRLAHAYLFSGPSGNGKTSIAKLFAKAINCESENQLICDECSNCEATKSNTHPDIVEIDAASNNGVDEIRSLIEKVKYTPLNGKYKVYIIDEVHMLSLGAFNALLKTLEEPPAHVVFILATTEPHKVIPTIISRCQRYDFTRVSEEDIEFNIKRILEKESISYEDKAISLISQLADGGVRESLSILEQTIAYAIDNIRLEDVRQIYGVVTKEEKLELLSNILNVKMEDTLNLLNKIADQGNNLERLNLELIEILKESVIYGYAKSEELLDVLTKEEVHSILNILSEDRILEMIDILMEISNVRKNTSDLHAYLELGFIKLINIASTSQMKSGFTFEKVETKKDELERLQSNNNSVEDVVEQPKAIIEPDLAAPKETPTKEQVETPKQESVEVEKQEASIEENPVYEGNPILEDVAAEEEVEDTKEEVVEVTESLVREIETYDDEMILSLLAHADKEKRISMDSKWLSINNYITDVDFAKYAHKLKFAQLIAVGTNYALVCVENQIVADDINSINNKIGISRFIEMKMDEELCIFAITESRSKEIIDLFRERAAKGTLPGPISITIPKEQAENKKNSLESKAESLFGENNFVVEE